MVYNKSSGFSCCAINSGKLVILGALLMRKTTGKKQFRQETGNTDKCCLQHLLAVNPRFLQFIVLIPTILK